MLGRVVHLRLSEELAQRLDMLCGVVQRSRSAAIRERVRYVLEHEGLWAELLARPTSTTLIDMRTPEQAAAWEQARAQFEHMDLSALLTQQPPPL
jgi:metal-responsive CopG/Arc/MetJ family transcriptional regulator